MFSQKVFSANAGKYRPEITPYLDIFRAVLYVPESITLYANVFLSMSRKTLKTIFFLIKAAGYNSWILCVKEIRLTQQIFTGSKSTIETLEKDVKYDHN